MESPPVFDTSGSRAPSALRVAGVTFVLALLGAAALFHFCPLLYDADAHYHLAIARIYAERGLVQTLPELRFSVLGTSFGDKELFFHFLLVPLQRFGEAGGRVALALLMAAVFAAIAAVARRGVGWWAVAVPFALFATALDFAWRLVRLRPELLSLLLLLALIVAASAGRFRLAGLVVALYTWSYTAFHAALGLAGLLAAGESWATRRLAWRLVLYASLGCGVALVVHPQFPANLTVWAVQNVSHFAIGMPLDFGREMEPHAPRDVVLLNLGWFVAMAALWRAQRDDPRPGAGAADGRGLGRGLAIAALVFAALYLGASRFGFYFFPFATLWLLVRAGARGGFAARLRLAGGRSVPLAAGLGLAALLATPELVAQSRLFAQRTSPGPRGERLVDRAAFARAIPAGAHVAAPWRATALYLDLAPQGRYLNVLDPVFMAQPYPEVYAAQRAVFDGLEPDVPLALVARLDSDVLAFSRVAESPVLTARLADDPRLEALYRGYQGVFRVLPNRNDGFVLDWRRVPAGAASPSPSALAAYPRYPRRGDRAAAVEGFVDARRDAAAEECARFGRVHAAGDAAGRYELAPYGTGHAELDGRRVAGIDAPQGAILGRGVRFEIPGDGAEHVLVVETCAPAAAPYNGFYLRSLPASSAAPSGR